MTAATATKIATALLGLCLAWSTGALAGAVPQDQSMQHMNAQFESPTYRMISDEDKALMQHVKSQMEDGFANFKDVQEVHAFLDKVKLLVQKHPKNVAFASGDLKELHKFLSEEMFTRLLRVDTAPFEMPISDERMAYAQRAVDDDELTRKLFGGPLRSLAEARRREMMPKEEGTHRDGGNFFSNFWCKISGNCSN